MSKLLVLLFVAGSWFIAEAKSTSFVEVAAPTKYRKKFSETCQGLVTKNYSAERAVPVCNCVVRNLARKITDEKFKLLEENYRGKLDLKAAKKKYPDFQATIAFEQDLAEECIEDSNFNISH